MGAPARLVHGCGHAVTPTVVCDHCGQPLRLDEVRLRSGPGRQRAEAATPSAPSTS
jgi:hypothetical protein